MIYIGSAFSTLKLQGIEVYTVLKLRMIDKTFLYVFFRRYKALTSSFHVLSDFDFDTSNTLTTALTRGLFICSSKLLK